MAHEPTEIVLASQSPRRKELMHHAGLKFRDITHEAEESYPTHLALKDIPVHIASKKAEAVRDVVRPDSAIIAADTIVCKDSKVMGKPSNEQEATHMLQELSGRNHQVMTGVVISTPAIEETFTEETSVTFKTLAPEEIEFYISRYKPFDKAGAYAIQEWIGLVAIDGLKGCYFNVVGLPVQRLWQKLQDITPHLMPISSS